MKNSKGFTLIELLVVIAIIGVLSSVVLASLNSARAKGSDAAIKSQLASMRPEAEIFYDGTVGNGTYGAAVAGASTGQCVLPGTLFAADTVLAGQITGVRNTAGTANVFCSTTGNPITAWAVAVTLKANTSNAWCVDSTGASKLQTAAATAGSFTASVCN